MAAGAFAKAVRAHWIAVALTLAVAAAGAFALHALLAEVSYAAVRQAFAELPARRLAAALILTGCSYFLLTLFDVSALRVIGRKLPWRTAALASFTSYALSHNFGLALLTGGSARLKVYRAAGLSPGEVGSVIALASLSFWYGILLLCGLGLVLSPQPLAAAGLTLPPAAARLAGSAALALLALPALATLLGWRKVAIAGWETPLPHAGEGVAMTLLSALDLAVACAALYVLLPAAAMPPFAVLLLGYALAAVAGLASHVPGGVGVFEAVVLATVPGNRAGLLAALVAYRVIYYLIPLAIAVVLLAGPQRALRKLLRPVRLPLVLAREAAPTIMSVLVFVGGLILLVSGVLPAIPERLRFVHDVVPRPFAEASHIAASLSGTLLLFLAPGLWRRLDGAFHATRLVLVAGMAFSLVKGLDYEEATALGAIAMALHLSRGAFYRRTSLLAEPLSPRWLVAALVALASSVVIGALAYRNTAYEDALWWQFAAHGDAARFVRATFAIAVGIAGFALWRLFAPARAPGPDPVIAPATFSAALSHSGSVDAFLALTGDKQFLVAPEGDAFLMYRVVGANWIVMGDPVGNPKRWSELLWTLRQRADARQGHLLLYQITTASVPLAIEMGLEIRKYGEEARIDLAAFTRHGPDAKDLRYAERRAIAAGASFEIVPATLVAGYLDELRAVSDAWLAKKRSGEKAFSLGRFDPDYLRQFPCAVIRVGGEIVAFANVLATPKREELSVDLMRHRAELPPGTMDFLFLRLIEWGQDQGYRWFTLGIAPLAGLEARRLAPIWAHAGDFLFRHGEAIYGFRGLRNYKAKFATHWEPRYVAGSGGLMLARGLAAVIQLVGSPERRQSLPRIRALAA